MIGHCRCGNTEVVWHWEHPEAIHPVICDCHYCTAHQARYVFRAGTAAEIRIKDPSLCRQVRQGTRTAIFLECRSCGMLIGATVEADGQTYGAFSQQCFPGQPFGTPVQLHSGNRPRADRLRQWQRHWCAPVTIHTQTQQNSPAQESPRAGHGAD